jgi:hypothetical protein
MHAMFPTHLKPQYQITYIFPRQYVRLYALTKNKETHENVKVSEWPA